MKLFTVLVFMTLMVFAVFSDQKPDNLQELAAKMRKCMKAQMQFTESEAVAARICQYLIRR